MVQRALRDPEAAAVDAAPRAHSAPHQRRRPQCTPKHTILLVAGLITLRCLSSMPLTGVSSTAASASQPWKLPGQSAATPSAVVVDDLTPRHPADVARRAFYEVLHQQSLQQQSASSTGQGGGEEATLDDTDDELEEGDYFEEGEVSAEDEGDDEASLVHTSSAEVPTSQPMTVAPWPLKPRRRHHGCFARHHRPHHRRAAALATAAAATATAPAAAAAAALAAAAAAGAVLALCDDLRPSSLPPRPPLPLPRRQHVARHAFGRER